MYTILLYEIKANQKPQTKSVGRNKHGEVDSAGCSAQILNLALAERGEAPTVCMNIYSGVHIYGVDVDIQLGPYYAQRRYVR